MLQTIFILELSPEVSHIFIATSEVPDLGVKYARLMRDFKIQETLFEFFYRLKSVFPNNSLFLPWYIEIYIFSFMVYIVLENKWSAVYILNSLPFKMDVLCNACVSVTK